MNTIQKPNSRLSYLDALRGIAALLVAIFFHYQHFSILFQSNSTGSIPPFYSFLPFKLFFDKGDLMVDVFFVLSGIVFSYTYRQTIEKGDVNGFDFFVRRFSRLYPIHLLTLFIVAVLVNLYYRSFNTYPLYKYNDSYHLVLNMFFLHRGFFDKGHSFNGPAWSLSIEVIMYVIFFCQAKLLRGIWSSVVLAAIGFVFYRSPIQWTFLLNVDVGRGLMGFFSGCLIYEILIKDARRLFIIGVPIISVLLFTVYFIMIKQFVKVPIHVQLIGILATIIPLLHHSELIQRLSKARVFQYLGDISLAVYMIHVPIQFCILYYYRFSNQIIPYSSPFFFVSYGLAVITAGFVLHYYFEKPMQRAIRKRSTKTFNGSQK